MVTYSISLSPEEDAALSYAALSQIDWIQGAATQRCKVAIDEIAKIAIEKCFEFNMQVPASKEALVTLAFEQGWVKTAAQRQEELEAAQAIEQPQE